MPDPAQQQAHPPSGRILLVDDDPFFLRLLEAALRQQGFGVELAERAEQALALCQDERYDLVLSDLQLPGMDGLELLRALRRSEPELPVIIATAHGSIESAVEALRAGAADYVTKPLNADELRIKVERSLRARRLRSENRQLHHALASGLSPGSIVAVSARMRELLRKIEKLCRSDATVLVTGESGTGKEWIVRALHFGGARAGGPFVALNCAALPAGLVERELFGSARGAFTGADRDSPGRLELAHLGTLFLDEVGELPLEAQAKLLRAIEQREFERVGEGRTRRVDVRFVAATNRDLQVRVREGQFREDLYFRLAVVPLEVPPLRERREDIPALVHALLARIEGAETTPITPEAMAALERRSWPGNVRELYNVLQRTLAFHGEGPILADELPPPADPGAGTAAVAEATTAPAAAPPPGRYPVALPAEGANLDEMIRGLVVQALERSGWNQSAAARLLRIPRHVLQYRMIKYDIVSPNRAAGSQGPAPAP